MSFAEKTGLIDSMTISFAENYGLNIKDVRDRISNLMSNYRVIYEEHHGDELSTEYLMGKFSDAKKATGMSEKTLYQYHIAVKKIEGITGKRLSDIETEDVNRFFIEYKKTTSSVTCRQKYQLLSSIYTFLFTRKYIGYNPMETIDPPKATVVYKKQLTNLELEKIKKACTELKNRNLSLRNTAMIYFFISTGCRVSELCNVKMANVDFEKKCCKLLGKGRKERMVILTDEAIYRIKLYLETRKDITQDSYLFSSVRKGNEELSVRNVEKTIKQIKESIGASEITCHTFRRFYATELRKRDVNIQLIAKSLGHANLNQINRYSLFTDDEMLNEIRRAIN